MSEYSHLRIECDALGDEAQVHQLSGHETLSQLFEFEVVVVVPVSSHVLGEDILGSPVTLIFDHVDEGDRATDVREIHGMVAQCDDLLLPGDFLAFRLHVRPRMWVAGIVETLDIYMEMSVPDIIKRKLGLLDMEEGEDFEMRLSDNYPAKEFVVQYKETDLAFISRLIEHVGITYFFEHDRGGDRIVFSDRNAAFRPLDNDEHVSFVGGGQELGVFELHAQHRIVPRMYVQRDYNYRNPATDLTASAELPDAFGGGVIEYGGHFKTEGEGKWLAEIRSQERNAERRVFHGRSDVAKLAAGRKMVLDGHLRGDIPLVLTSVRHEVRQTTMMGGHGDEVDYRNEFTAVMESTEYRPPRVTPRPRISGTVTGIIDAAAQGEYAELDSEGRYRVKFMFDTSEAGEGKASRAVRMMQPHSGAGYGMHFPLRPGTEVLITFVDGDPDRPIIAGTVPNPQTASPVSSDNATRNVIRTGGGNEINIDDESGSHRIKMMTPTSNTTFQLGAPNDPENGAMLSTLGASTTVASTGMSNLGAFKGGYDAFMNFTDAGDIVSVAATPKFVPTALGLIEALSNIVTATVATIEAAMDLREKAASQQATEDAEKATKAQLACKECRDKAKDALPPTIDDIKSSCANPTAGCTHTTETGCTLTDDEKAAVADEAAYTARRDKALVSMAQMDAADVAYDNAMSARKLHNSANADAAEQSTDQHDRAVVLKEQSTAESEAQALIISQIITDGSGSESIQAAMATQYQAWMEEKTGDSPLSPADQAKVDDWVESNKAAVAASMGALSSSGDPDPMLVGTSAADKKADAVSGPPDNGLFASFEAQVAACDQPYTMDKPEDTHADKPCCADLQQAREDAAGSNAAYNDMVTDHGPHKDECGKAKAAMATVGLVKPLVSGLMFIIGKLKVAQKSLELSALWESSLLAGLQVSGPPPRTAPGVAFKPDPSKVPSILPPLPMRDAPKHVIGSERSTHITAGDNVMVQAPKVMITGLGTKKVPAGVDLIGREVTATVPDPSAGRVAVVGMEEVRINSPKKVEVSALMETGVYGQEVDVHADVELKLTALNRVAPTTNSTIEILSDGTTKIGSTSKDIEIKAKLGALNAESTTYKLDVKTTADILANSAINVLIGDNGMCIDPSMTGIGFASYYVALDAGGIELDAGGSMAISPTGVEVTGAKVDVKANGVLTVDGSLVNIG